MARRKGRAVSETVGIAPVQFPPGTVISFAGSTAPEGWMLCDGAAISRTQYAALFAAIGTLWGNGNGSTTFNLPDLEGRFLRGADNGAAVDPDAGTRVPLGSGVANGVGSLQNNALGSHGHTQRGNTATGSGLVGFNLNFNVTSAQINTSVTTTNTGGSESRPSNCSVNYIIKL